MSDSFGLSVTRNEVIAAALRTIGAIGKGQSPDSTDYTNCSQALNLMIKAWVNKGARLWKIETLVVPLVEGVTVYPLGPSASYLASAGVTITDGGAGTDGTYALGIADAGGGTGAAGTYTVEDGTVTEVTITAAGSAYVTPVLTFPSGGVTGTDISIVPIGLTGDRPIRLYDESFIRDNTTSLDTMISQISRQEYNQLGSKSTASGIPTQIWYDPQLGNGNLYVYPVMAAGLDKSLHLVVQIYFNDATSASSTFDFPQEFTNALKWGLAREIMTEYEVDDRTEARVERFYQQYVEEAFSYNEENEAITFVYDTTRAGSWG